MNKASTGNSQSASEEIRFNLTQSQITAPLLATPVHARGEATRRDTMHAGPSLNLAAIAVLIPVVILQRRESGATLAWILAIVLIPFLGLLAFWVFGTTRLHLRRRKRRRIEARLAPALHKLQAQSATNLPVADLPPSLLQLAVKLDEAGPQPGNQVVLLRQGPAAFNALEAAIDGARHHIHLGYGSHRRAPARCLDAGLRSWCRGAVAAG